MTNSQVTAKNAGFVPDTLKALLFAPNSGAAERFRQALGGELQVKILEEELEFPSPAKIERQIALHQPEIVFLDISENAARADELVRLIRSRRPLCLPVVLHTTSDPSLVVELLRAGAADFLQAPFHADDIQASLARLRKILRPESVNKRECRGRVIAFVSAKPGAGASTLASQAAFALKRATGQKVLLADFNLRAGTSHCWLDPRRRYASLMDVAESSANLADPAAWTSWTATLHGVDLLPSPAEPQLRRIPRERMEEILESLRWHYDWVLVDLPSLADETTLAAMTLADEVEVVTTTELSSLHLAHKLRRLIELAGVDQRALRLAVNRARPNDVITSASLEKSLRMQVAGILPNDYFALHSAGSSGHPLVGEGKLAAGIKQLASRLCQHAGPARPGAAVATFPASASLQMAMAR